MNNREFSNKISAVEPSMMRYAQGLTKDYADAQDLCQEAIIKAYTNWDKYSDIENLGAFMNKIVYNTFINTYTKKQRRSNIFKMVTPSSCPIISLVDTNRAESKLEFSEIKNEVDRLGDKYRVPLMMYATGYSYDEIGTELNVPIGTIKSRINYSRKKLEKSKEILYSLPSRKAA